MTTQASAAAAVAVAPPALTHAGPGRVARPVRSPTSSAPELARVTTGDRALPTDRSLTSAPAAGHDGRSPGGAGSGLRQVRLARGHRAARRRHRPPPAGALDPRSARAAWCRRAGRLVGRPPGGWGG